MGKAGPMGITSCGGGYDMTFCRLIAKRLSMRHLIMSVQEVLVTGCACMLVCLFCMGIPGAHIAS